MVAIEPLSWGLITGNIFGLTRGDAGVCLEATRYITLAAVKFFAWDDDKNAKLKAARGIGFEDVVFHIERGDLLDILTRAGLRFDEAGLSPAPEALASLQAVQAWTASDLPRR